MAVVAGFHRRLDCARWRARRVLHGDRRNPIGHHAAGDQLDGGKIKQDFHYSNMVTFVNEPTARPHLRAIPARGLRWSE